MAIPSKQIGQPSNTKAGLLWQISKQLETLTKVAGNVYIPAASTVDIYSTELSFPIPYASMSLRCDNSGNNLGDYVYTNETANDIDELVDLFNTNSETSAYGTYSAVDGGLKLTTSQSIEACCNGGIVYINVFSD